MLKKLKDINIITSNGINPKYKVILQRQLPILQEIIIHTSFVINQSKSSLRERLYCIVNNITSIPLCRHCNINPVKFCDDGKYRNMYRPYCSLKCSNNADEVKNKKERTVLDHYGVSNPSQSDTIHRRKIKTSQQKHGTEYPWQNITTQETLQQPNVLSQLHIEEKLTLTKISKLIGCNKSVVSNYFKKYDISVINFPISSAEKELVMFFREHNVDNIITNSRTIISPYELDIYLPDYNLAIEYCGLYWHCSKHKRMTPRYHKHKLDECTKSGIRLITIFEDEWIHNSDLVKNKLLNIIHKANTPTVFARKCVIAEVVTNLKTSFFDTYHIQGNGPGSINIGLEYNQELVACMSFIKQQNGIYVLNRYATNKNVVGGFSKLLSYFKKTYEWKEIVSFADLRWSQGKVYQINGFMLDKILPPDYEYVDLIKIKRIHKFNFRHKHLPKRLDVYDPNLSETQNTINNGIYKIYACGLQRWVLYNH